MSSILGGGAAGSFKDSFCVSGGVGAPPRPPPISCMPSWLMNREIVYHKIFKNVQIILQNIHRRARELFSSNKEILKPAVKRQKQTLEITHVPFNEN